MLLIQDMKAVLVSVSPSTMLSVATPFPTLFLPFFSLSFRNWTDRQAFDFPDSTASGGDHVPQCGPIQGLWWEKGGHLGNSILVKETHSWGETQLPPSSCLQDRQDAWCCNSHTANEK